MQSASELKALSSTWSQTLKKRLARINRLFLMTVVVPTILATIYFGLIASDVYISESRFVVRSPDRQAATGLGALFKGAGFSRSQDDSYTVYDFMKSRDALGKINVQLPLAKAFGGSNIDLFSRFNGLGLDGSHEALYLYYQNRIVIDMDTASSISALKVSAFKAEDAYRINAMLLDMGEQLINQLNERGRQDMIRFATSEVQIAEQKAKAAGLALSAYRSNQTVFDPEKQSVMQFAHIAKLQDELIATKSQLTQLLSFAPANPQISSLELHVKTLQQGMDAEMAKVTGGKASLSDKSAEYQRLSLDSAFADKQLGAALASLEQARNEAQRQQLYLERIVQPNKPDVALEPKRARNILATIFLSLTVFGVLSMLLAGIREHQD